jgi:hypothetical protein
VVVARPESVQLGPRGEPCFFRHPRPLGQLGLASFSVTREDAHLSRHWRESSTDRRWTAFTRTQDGAVRWRGLDWTSLATRPRVLKPLGRSRAGNACPGRPSRASAGSGLEHEASGPSRPPSGERTSSRSYASIHCGRPGSGSARGWVGGAAEKLLIAIQAPLGTGVP